MKTLIAAASLAAALLAGSAGAEDRTIYADGTWTVRIEQVDLADPADLARVVEAVRAAGLDACRGEPTRNARRACADGFAANAIGDVARPEMRTALLHTLTSGGAVAVAEVE